MWEKKGGLDDWAKTFRREKKRPILFNPQCVSRSIIEGVIRTLRYAALQNKRKVSASVAFGRRRAATKLQRTHKKLLLLLLLLRTKLFFHFSVISSSIGRTFPPLGFQVLWPDVLAVSSLLSDSPVVNQHDNTKNRKHENGSFSFQNLPPRKRLPFNPLFLRLHFSPSFVIVSIPNIGLFFSQNDFKFRNLLSSPLYCIPSARGG